MATEHRTGFEIQKLTVSNDYWAVELLHEDKYSAKKVIESEDYPKIIVLNNDRYWGSQLVIKATNKKGEVFECLITDIDGGTYLHLTDDKDESQSVKLLNDNLILSLGFTFLSFNIAKQEVEWKLRPDMAEVFEFYDLQSDYLVRGETEIHRIDNNGNVKWSYGGRDIWVNIEGKREVVIEGNNIRLTDFAGNVYLIDSNGQTLEDRPFVSIRENKK